MIVENMIKIYQASEAGSTHNKESWMEDSVMYFKDEDYSLENHLPLPGTSNSSPLNSHQFLTHIVLSLGKCNTEIDGLTHASFHECSRKACLIENDTDLNLLKQ